MCVYIYIYIYVYMDLYIYIYIYIYVCVCTPHVPRLCLMPIPPNLHKTILALSQAMCWTTVCLLTQIHGIDKAVSQKSNEAISPAIMTQLMVVWRVVEAYQPSNAKKPGMIRLVPKAYFNGT
jgi:hypothetical protein